jgi:hypothetical protein
VIIEWLVQVASGFWGWIANLFPDWTLPPELANPNGLLGQIMSFGRGLEPFVNWTLVGIIGAIPLAVWGIGIAAKLVLKLVSHLPFIGGNG